MQNKVNKRKVFNDPVYGFITIPYKIIYDLIEDPTFQRLRRISQLGLTHLVYPGAVNNRYHHAIGAMHLMHLALINLKSKGVEISKKEEKAALIAILLHDVGHGPYSHALEHSIVRGCHHEKISLSIMQHLNKKMKGKLDLAIQIFKGEYDRPFFHQLVSSQLDVDRLDYLKRDSFYSGVSEGVIGNQRIIKMLSVKDDHLVVEQKGIYSIEKFLVARRLMYWQVYLHKTVLVAETILAKVLQRAKYVVEQGGTVFGSPALLHFLYHDVSIQDFEDGSVMQKYIQLDDYDVMGAIKVWADHSDQILSELSDQLVNRRLSKISISNEPFDDQEVAAIEEFIAKKKNIAIEETHYYVMNGQVENKAYNLEGDPIQIMYKDGSTVDVTEASDNLSISLLGKPVQKYYLIYPRA